MPNKVVSKYFSTRVVMEDSLSDFKVKKNYKTGPKNNKKTQKPKPRNTKCQKDIRTLIKQKSDVISYSKDFDKVCKQEEIDVDPEELQLAIALSNSLQTDNALCSDADTESTDNLTHQQKIKTTLKEYGFKISNRFDRKHNRNNVNRKKRYRKLFKLLLISEAERKQIVSDKYSEVLTRNIFKSPGKVFEYNYNDKELYYKTTNIPYELVKNDDIYYVKDLFVNTQSKTFSLKDWSQIPGRPLSPITVQANDINFDDIICIQNELDCILSGTIIKAQNIITRINIKKDYNGVNDIKIKNTPKELHFHTQLSTMSVSQRRCFSPDLFDDDDVAFECKDNILDSVERVSSHDYNNTVCMDLTECIKVESMQKTDHKMNITKRKSNDLMEITECVSTDLQPMNIDNIDLTQNFDNIVSQNKNIEIMDLTQATDYDLPTVDVRYKKKASSIDDTIIIVDDDCNVKFQPRESMCFIPESMCVVDNAHNCKQNSKQNSRLSKVDHENKIDCNVKEYSHNDSFKKYGNEDGMTIYNFNDLNITKTNYSSIEKDEESNLKITRESFADEVCNNIYKRKRYSFENKVGEMQHDNKYMDYQKEEKDLTHSSNSAKCDIVSINPGNRNKVSKDYDDVVILSESQTCKGKIISTDLVKRHNISIDYEEICEDVILNESQTYKSETVSTSPGKRDNISIDYDNVILNKSTCLKRLQTRSNGSNVILKDANDNRVIASNTNNSSEVLVENQCSLYENLDYKDVAVENTKNYWRKGNHSNSNNYIASCSSNIIGTLEIPNKEYNYINCTDVSVPKEFSNFENNANFFSTNHNDIKNTPLNNLISKNIVSPLNKVTPTRKLDFNDDPSPTRVLANVENVLQTPKNREYIIKTNEVTPMLDFASMSSPERHKELEKYGLKPFKRKKAIQLLTYLYNQTHPVVESDDCLLPSKRQKKDDGGIQYTSHDKTTIGRSSINQISVVKNVPVLNKQNDLYTVTNEEPDIRNIECDAEDWMFQKREKVKVQSCRIPLHVAFHNYLSCRRKLREAILRYEPVNIDIIHKDLVATGYRYNPKDLLKFMDRKCITVRTADNKSRNRKS